MVSVMNVSCMGGGVPVCTIPTDNRRDRIFLVMRDNARTISTDNRRNTTQDPRSFCVLAGILRIENTAYTI